MKFCKMISDVALVGVALAMYAVGIAATILGARRVIDGASLYDPLMFAFATAALSAGVLGSMALLDLFERSTLPHRLKMKRERSRLVRSHDRNMIGSRDEY